MLDAPDDIVDATGQPALLGPPVGIRRIARKHAIVEVGSGDSLGQMGLPDAQRVRNAHGDRLLDGIGRIQWGPSKTRAGIVFYGDRGRVFGFDHDRLRRWGVG